MSTWLINGSTPESHGLTITSGTWRSGAASTVTLTADTAFDSTEIFSHDQSITITRDGAPFFRGSVRSIPKTGSSNEEKQSYLVEDAWAQLERTTYQEPWKVSASSSVLMPVVILGMDSAGNTLTMGQQIAEVITFAATAGISIQQGTLPDGMTLWPSKATGISCADVIRTSLKYHPDWIPWIDHATNPPTFHVTTSASAHAQSLDVTACSSVSVTRTNDRVPDCVRIVYLTAEMTGDEVMRDGAIDKYPTTGSDNSPGTLTTVVNLSGQQSQIQKQQVQTRTIPTSQEMAKEYLRKKFPEIKDIADDKFNVTEWTVTPVAETEDAPDPINPLAPRLVGTSFSEHLPRELVKGSVQEWMRCRIGKLSIQMAVTATSSASSAEIALLAALPTNAFQITATNALTKIYTGLSSWTPAENIPLGVAKAYYDTLTSGCFYEGEVTLIESEIGATRWHGCKLNVTGGVSDWSTMGAPIHQISWNLESCEINLNFGPNPDYSVADFREYLRMLSSRPATWMSAGERSSHKLGSSSNPSAAGDTVAPFDVPETYIPQNAGQNRPFTVTGGAGNLVITESTLAGSVPSGFSSGIKTLSVAGNGYVLAKVVINSTTGAVTSQSLITATTITESDHTTFYTALATYSTTDGILTANNLRFGPIDVQVCRNWFASSDPFFGLTFSGS